jgi:hypothetical protein
MSAAEQEAMNRPRTVTIESPTSVVANGADGAITRLEMILNDETVHWSASTTAATGRVVYQADHALLRIDDEDERALAASFQRAKPSGGDGWLRFFQAAITTAQVLSDPTGRAYNDFIAQNVPVLAPLVNAVNQMGVAAGTTAAGAAAGASGAMGGAGYPTRQMVNLGSTCPGFTLENYRTRSFEGGADTQLFTMCGHAFEYYNMYLNAIRQGYSEADANRTYSAHEQSARVAIAFRKGH